jgi:hypothetical protein
MKILIKRLIGILDVSVTGIRAGWFNAQGYQAIIL